MVIPEGKTIVSISIDGNEVLGYIDGYVNDYYGVFVNIENGGISLHEIYRFSAMISEPNEAT